MTATDSSSPGTNPAPPLPDAAPHGGLCSARAVPRIDIVVPVHNEAAALEASIHRLHGFLTEAFPSAWRIVIADTRARMPPVTSPVRSLRSCPR